MTFTIRPAGVDDADDIGAVHVRAWQTGYRGVMPDEYLDGLLATDRAASWRRHLSAPPGAQHLRVIVLDHDVVGFAGFGPEASAGPALPVGELYVLNVDPSAWGRGLGRALLRNAVDELAQLGHTAAVLWVVPRNERARRLYESEGWSDDGMVRNDEVFGVVVAEMRYRRLLAP